MNFIMISDWLELREPKNVPFIIPYRFTLEGLKTKEDLANAFSAAATSLLRKIENYSECYKVHNIPGTPLDSDTYIYYAKGLTLKAFYECDSIIVVVCVETC